MESERIETLIIGAQKAGTTTALAALSSHPLLVTNAFELPYFVNDEVYAAGWPAARARYFGRTEGRRIFAKSVAMMYSAKALDRLARHNPEARLHVFLRDPVPRAYSAWNYARQQGWEDHDDFLAALDAARDPDYAAGSWGHCDYFGRGEYARHFDEVFARFPREQVTVWLTSDLAAAPERVLRAIADAAAGAEAPDWRPNASRRNGAAMPRSHLLARVTARPFPGRALLKALVPGAARDRIHAAVERLNKVPYTPAPIPEAAAALLAEHFRPHNDRLARLIGRDLSGWTGMAPARRPGADPGAAPVADGADRQGGAAAR